MYIEPNTKIKLIKNAPIDNKYEHTIFFATPEAQTYYFVSLTTGYYFDKLSYQRVNKGTLRVQMNAENLYNCNYMAFQNTAFGSKWFYAFVTKVEYVNNVTSEITYEIDIMQTWHFNYKMMPCFVQREHSSTDVAGDNLIPENLDTGEYVVASSGQDTELEALSIVIATTFDSNFDPSQGGTYSQLYTGFTYHVFPMGYYPLDPTDPYYDADHAGEYGPDVAMQFIADATSAGVSSGISMMFMMPRCFVTPDTPNPSLSPKSHTKTITKDTAGTIDGYMPKNNKLFTYPYNFLYVTNYQGTGVAYPYEYFSGTSCVFDVSGDMSPNPSVLLRPENYKGMQINTDEKMVLGGYPQIPFNVDVFKAWLAMNSANIAVDALSAATSIGMGAVTDHPWGVASGVMSIGRTLANVYEHSLLPPQAKGSAGSITACAFRIQNFGFLRKTVRAEYAQIIDNYFDVYGYACHRIKVPNRTVRPEWNYVKTINCKIEPGYPTDASVPTSYPENGLPSEDSKRIEEIYDKGITFWHIPHHVSDYSYVNTLNQGGDGNGE